MNKKKLLIVIAIIVIIICTIMLFSNRNSNSSQLPDPNEENIKVVQIVLYFINKDTQSLEKEYRFVNIDDVKADVSGTIMKELMAGPTYENLVSSIPEGTIINNIEQAEDTITVDFSKEFIENMENENLSVYSVVNSLTELKEIDKVKFLIDGKEQEKCGQIAEFNKPLQRKVM